jgi:pSer/pThr/pTyr-binding forkhead associated (FHA) protein
VGSNELVDMGTTGAKLIVRRPNVPEVEILLEKKEFVIGRAPSEVDLTLDDDMVSRKHARVTLDSRGYFRLEDLGSRNGISYAGRLVRRLNLVDGDKFNIGKTEMEFHASMSRFKAADAEPRVDSVFADVPVPEPKASVVAESVGPASSGKKEPSKG